MCLGGMIALMICFSLLQAQTYVWKGGYPLVIDPDSITFTAPDYSVRVDTAKDAPLPSYDITYLTQDYAGRPIWMSARLTLTARRWFIRWLTASNVSVAGDAMSLVWTAATKQSVLMRTASRASSAPNVSDAIFAASSAPPALSALPNV